MTEYAGIVTDLQEISRLKYSVYLDERFAFVLYKGELSSYKITVGEPLSQRTYEEINNEILPKRARKRCLNLLKARPYTEKGLRTKLKEGKYPPEIIDRAIEYVKGFHYIDDYEYACEYIRCNKSRRSRRSMEEKLRERGIIPEVLQQALNASYEEEEEERLQYELASHYLKKKGFHPREADNREKRRIYAFLMRKGISTGIICRLLDVDGETGQELYCIPNKVGE